MFHTGTTFQLKSNFTPSLTLAKQEPALHKSSKRTNSSSTSGFQSQEASLTMPQLKRMRQASMSIIRRTGRTQQNTDRKFSACNPGFDLGDNVEGNDFADFETYESEDNEEAPTKRTPEATCQEIDNFPSPEASTCSPDCHTVKRQPIPKTETLPSSVRTESPQVMFENSTSDDICQQRESIVAELTQVTIKQ